MKIKTRQLVIGVALVIIASLLLAVQTDFSFKKKEEINMYIFKDNINYSQTTYNQENISLESLEITTKENRFF